jgi:putative transposase
VNGRKRHLVVDTLGLLLTVMVHAADIRDGDAGLAVIAQLMGHFPRLRKIWADQGYAGALEAWVEDLTGWTLEIVHRPKGMQGFAPLPRRWVVERTIGWFGRYRGLAKDYEQVPQSSEAMVWIVMIQVMLKRLAPT